MKLNSLREVLADGVKDLYSAENLLVKALPKMAKGCNSEALRDALTHHLEETKGHVERLERVAEALDITPKGKTCKAMKGLIEEGQEILEKDGDPSAVDAAIICAAQKVEHYEIASYGSMRTFATLLGENEIADLFQQTLDEEGTADKKLTDVAESGLNQEAAQNEMVGQDGR